MLVLTRKLNQSIQIGDDIRVTILSTEGERVSIGIDAPRSVKIYRTELLEETTSINRESALAAADKLLEFTRMKHAGKPAANQAPASEPAPAAAPEKKD